MKFNINIPQPCHENWNKMMPEQKGRHCEACKTVVTDFTNMTDAEIINHLKSSSSKTCGRFLETQLNRELIEPTKTYDWLSIPKLSAAASILFSLLQLPALAQNKNEIKTEQTQVLKNDSLRMDTLKETEIKKLPIREIDSLLGKGLIIGQVSPDNLIIGGSRQNVTSIIPQKPDIIYKRPNFWNLFKRKIRRWFYN
jgi:hypothetical protein